MHLHTTATQAVCCLRDGLAFTNFYAAQLYGKVAYHDFEGITVHADEGARILESADGRPVLLLRNHGPVTIGHTLPQALSLMWVVNRACEIQLATQSMGEAIADSDAGARETACADSLNFNPKYGAGEDSLRRAAAHRRPQGPGLPSLAAPAPQDLPARLATSCFSICSAPMAPGTCLPSSKTRPGVPLMRCLRPKATLRCRTEVSHCGCRRPACP